jgi:hypothetical protein
MVWSRALGSATALPLLPRQPRIAGFPLASGGLAEHAAPHRPAIRLERRRHRDVATVEPTQPPAARQRPHVESAVARRDARQLVGLPDRQASRRRPRVAGHAVRMAARGLRRRPHQLVEVGRARPGVRPAAPAAAARTSAPPRTAAPASRRSTARPSPWPRPRRPTPRPSTPAGRTRCRRGGGPPCGSPSAPACRPPSAPRRRPRGRVRRLSRRFHRGPRSPCPRGLPRRYGFPYPVPSAGLLERRRRLVVEHALELGQRVYTQRPLAHDPHVRSHVAVEALIGDPECRRLLFPQRQPRRLWPIDAHRPPR